MCVNVMPLWSRCMAFYLADSSLNVLLKCTAFIEDVPKSHLNLNKSGLLKAYVLVLILWRLQHALPRVQLTVRYEALIPLLYIGSTLAATQMPCALWRQGPLNGVKTHMHLMTADDRAMSAILEDVQLWWYHTSKECTRGNYSPSWGEIFFAIVHLQKLLGWQIDIIINKLITDKIPLFVKGLFGTFTLIVKESVSRDHATPNVVSNSDGWKLKEVTDTAQSASEKLSILLAHFKWIYVDECYVFSVF